MLVVRFYYSINFQFIQSNMTQIIEKTSIFSKNSIKSESFDVFFPNLILKALEN